MIKKTLKNLKRHKCIWEVILIISSVFIFRGLWTLMDKVEFLNKSSTHAFLLIFGIVITFIALHKVQ